MRQSQSRSDSPSRSCVDQSLCRLTHTLRRPAKGKAMTSPRGCPRGGARVLYAWFHAEPRDGANGIGEHGIGQDVQPGQLNEQSRVIDERHARSLGHPSRRGRCLRKLDPAWPFPMGRRELPAQDGCESRERERREIVESLAGEMGRGLAAVARHPGRGGRPIEHQSKRQCAESDRQEQALEPSSRLANASSRWQELSDGRGYGRALARPRRSGPGRPISTRGLHRRHHGALSAQAQGRLHDLHPG